MRRNIDILLEVLIHRVPVKLEGRVYVIIEDAPCMMVVRKNTELDEKSIEYLTAHNLTLDFLIQQAKKLDEGEVVSLVYELTQAKNYIKKYGEMPEMFRNLLYEEELLNSL